MKVHHVIQQFQNQAEMLDALRTPQGLDDAISELALWMDLKQTELSPDDWTMLVNVGGLLYREGLRWRMQDGGGSPDKLPPAK